MKPIKLLVVAVVLFGSSAGVSWYLQSKMKKDSADAKAKHDPGNEKVLKEPDLNHAPARKEAKDESPSPANSLFRPEAESVVQMASALKTQMEAIKGKEKQLTVRQKNLEAIYDDLKKERGGLDELKQKIVDEMKLLNEKIDFLEKKSVDTQSERQKVTDRTKELKQTLLEVDDAEKTRIKQIANMVEGMEPEAAGRTLMALAEGGKMDMAVKVVANMKEKQAAKILNQIGDEGFAAQVFDKLKGLKSPPKAKD